MTVVIPDAKEKKVLIGSSTRFANGEPDIKFDSLSVRLAVSLEVKEKSKKITKNIGALWKLPEEIQADKSHFKCKKAKVEIFLMKAEEKTWAGAISQGVDMERLTTS
ncbi:uncharacterized protein LOC141914748 isoform X2 [Tubulanus polymorphus]